MVGPVAEQDLAVISQKFAALEMAEADLRECVQPAEWAPHDACWLAWPSHEDLWLENLPAAQAEFTALVKAIAESERVELMVPADEQLAQVEKIFAGCNVRFHKISFGDIWVRDTAPIFVWQKDGRVANVRFKFNGWGEKYLLEHDDQVSFKVARESASQGIAHGSVDWVLEGGSIDVDGEGTCLTTTQCLLNPNRNPEMTARDLEKSLRDSLGITKVIWLKDGLINDHTDGHIDTIVRFASPGVVLCMEAREQDDPNREILAQLIHDLENSSDAKGRKLKVVRAPSPGTVLNEEGRLMPASYMNFYISNKTVIVPVYGTRYDDEAVRVVGSCFPNHKTIGLSARAILSGGGAFHCITQQQPKGRSL